MIASVNNSLDLEAIPIIHLFWDYVGMVKGIIFRLASGVTNRLLVGMYHLFLDKLISS